MRKKNADDEKFPDVGWVYVLCFDSPRTVRDSDFDWTESVPVSHYVGWTGQLPPINRVQSHGRGMARHLVSLTRGTLIDEYATKDETCVVCGCSLNYYREALEWLYAHNGDPSLIAWLRTEPKSTKS